MGRTTGHVLAVVCCALFGCAQAPIYNVSASNNGGIPFFERLPVHKEAIVVEQAWTQLDVTLHGKMSDAKGTPQEVTISARRYFPVGDPSIAKELAKFHGKDLAGALQVLQGLAGDVTAPPSGSFDNIWSTVTAADRDAAVVADSCSVDHVAGARQFFINVQAPRGGSAQADVKLGADGTLSGASGGVTDSLPGTIATAAGTVITAAGAIGAAAITGGASIAVASIAAGAAAATAGANKIFGLPNPVAPAAQQMLTVTATMTPGRRLYTLELLWPFAREELDQDESTTPDRPPNLCGNPCLHDNSGKPMPLSRLVPLGCEARYSVAVESPGAMPPTKLGAEKAAEGK